MRLLRLDPSATATHVPPESVVCHDVRNPAQRSEVLVRKGTRLAREQVLDLLERGVQLHLAVPELSDVDEDEAAARLAEAVAGNGVTIERAHYGQVTLSSTARGFFRVRAELLERVNQADGVLVMTSQPDCAADNGAPLGVVKCAPLFLAGSTIEEVEALRAKHGAVVEVIPFRPRRVAFIAPGERVRGGAFDRATESLKHALEWFGSSLPSIVRTEATEQDVAAGFKRAADDGAELILAAGAAATDPLDLMFEGMRLGGGQVDQIGIPAEPGTACWIGRFDGRPVLGLASCELFGRPGALDLLLPRLLTDAPLDRALLQRIALGGLLMGGPSRILPYHVADETSPA
jgi:molybdenum cofactor cytidylyltransferase